jgi:hypothetical protein
MMLSQAETLDARNGSPTIRATLDDGRRLFLHSPYEPEREAKTWAADFRFGPRDLVILYGVGAGHGLQALLPKLGPQNLLIAVEPLEAVLRAGNSLSCLNEARKDARVHWARNWSDVLKAFDAIENSCWRQPRLVVTPVYRQLDPESLEEFAREFLKQKNVLDSFRATVFQSAETWQANLFANLPQLAQAAPISRVFGALQRKPAIIVSAGPSLEKNVELLREAKDHALIIATGTAARLLSTRGIHSDFVLAVDAGENNYAAHFQDISHPGSILAFDPTVHPMIPREHQGKKALFTIYPDTEWLNHYIEESIGLIKTGGSVSNVAFDLACKLGADPVILIGQDLAYPSVSSHAPGSFSERFPTVVPQAWIEGDDQRLEAEAQTNGIANKFQHGGRILIPAIGGGTVPTDRVLYSYLIWFEREIATLGSQRTVIDATEGGALIQGSRVLDLRVALDRFCAVSISKIIGEIRTRLSPPARIDMDRLIRDLHRLKPEIQALDSTLAEASSLLETPVSLGLDRQDLAQIALLSERDAKIGDYLERLKWRFHFLFTPYLVAAQDLSSRTEFGPAQGFEERQLIYKALRRVAQTGSTLLDNALNSMGNIARVTNPPPTKSAERE